MCIGKRFAELEIQLAISKLVTRLKVVAPLRDPLLKERLSTVDLLVLTGLYLLILILQTGNTKGGSITVLMTSCLTGLESAV
jgi:hypothetical protein